MKRYFFPLLLGIVGCAVLASLGLWQLDRADQKAQRIAEIESRIGAAPVALPADVEVGADRYLPVRVSGTTTGEELHVLTSLREEGPGYRLISAFETDGGRRIMVDEGFIRESEKDLTRPGTEMTVAGNLDWPRETDRFTPAPDLERDLWFARDVAGMAETLGTEPVLIVARTVTGTDARATPLPVVAESTVNHLGYAIQWFGLALVWAGMSAFLVWRIARRTA